MARVLKSNYCALEYLLQPLYENNEYMVALILMHKNAHFRLWSVTMF